MKQFARDLIYDFGILGAAGILWAVMLIPCLLSMVIAIVVVRITLGPFGKDGHPMVGLYLLVIWHAVWAGFCSGLRRIAGEVER